MMPELGAIFTGRGGSRNAPFLAINTIAPN